METVGDIRLSGNCLPTKTEVRPLHENVVIRDQFVTSQYHGRSTLHKLSTAPRMSTNINRVPAMRRGLTMHFDWVWNCRVMRSQECPRNNGWPSVFSTCQTEYNRWKAARVGDSGGITDLCEKGSEKGHL